MTRHQTKLLPLLTWRSAIGDSDLDPTTRHVALALSLYMSEKGDSAHPGRTRLAHDTGYHADTVKTHLRVLVDRGWLVVTSRGGRLGQRRHANEYEACVPTHGGSCAPGVVDTRVSSAPGSENWDTGGPAPRDGGSCAPPIPPENSPLISPGRATRIPIPFVVTQEMAEWAAREIPAYDWRAETPNFKDYWLAAPGKKGVKLDWVATWRKWMRTANERASR